MLGFLFNRKSNKEQDHVSVSAQFAEKKKTSRPVLKIQAEEIGFDDSELGLNVSFDAMPMTREQMRKLDMAL
ncbi:MAG: hypothetical protein Q4A84_02745 [Neisseria sp.]|uniref:hypothetical protein n=1 Tax=Neisseria sp. TaxID=192066 RepID=UPI0026DD2AC2|nr:hypothetical protein [Neisseria sp.]MDO4640609.1 hypothetical protein [Neisseria sp.]